MGLNLKHFISQQESVLSGHFSEFSGWPKMFTWTQLQRKKCQLEVLLCVELNHFTPVKRSWGTRMCPPMCSMVMAWATKRRRRYLESRKNLVNTLSNIATSLVNGNYTILHPHWPIGDMRLCKSEPKEKVGSNGGRLTGGTRVDLKVGTERERIESESV